MFCSKCGQEQASESVRFCARCGCRLSTHEEGLAKRLILMAMYLVITISALFGWGSITAGPGYMGIRVFVAIVAAITFYLLFANDFTHILSKLSSQNIEEKKRIASSNHESTLPAGHGIPLASLGSRSINTAEMVPLPSVTEHTTALLDKNKH